MAFYFKHKFKARGPNVFLQVTTAGYTPRILNINWLENEKSTPLFKKMKWENLPKSNSGNNNFYVWRNPIM